MKEDSLDNILNVIAQTVFDKKGFNILALDVRDVSTLTDFFLIAEGTVGRHVRAISIALEDVLTQLGYEPLHIEGKATGDWIVMDYGVILIHLFQPDLREKYALEQLWNEGKVIDLEIEVTKTS